jgi:hypothetical protein
MRWRRLRQVTEAERMASEKLAHARTAPARQGERARTVWQASQGQMVPAIAAELRLTAGRVRDRLQRFGRRAWPGWRTSRAPVARRPARPSRRRR